MPLLSREERNNVQTYQYHGGDSSPTYKYFLSPFAQFCVDNFTPRWIAPNMITLLGLLLSVIATILTLIYNPQLSLYGPRWVHLLTGICVFSYQTLDNMDGKQARRTGSSSALGMLFDHGCDAINAGISAITMASVLGTGWTSKMFFCLCCGYVPFYFQTWEEYYLGAMILPPFNGPSDGLLMCVAICFLSFAKGPEWFQSAPIELPQYLLLDSPFLDSLHVPTRSQPFITPLSIAMLMGYSATFSTMVVQVLKVLWTLSAKKQSLVKPMLDLLPFLVFFPSLFYWCSFSNVAFPVHPVVTIVLMNAVFVDMAVHLMLCHICKSDIKPFERHGAYVIGLLALYVWLKPAGVSDVYETWATYALAIIFIAKTSAMIYTVCKEVSETLDIWVLKLGKRHNK